MALDYPGWSGFISGLTPQTVVFTNHGTLTVFNVVGMPAGYPQYWLHNNLDNVPSPFTTNLPALYPNGLAYSWSVSFAPPLTFSDYVIITDVDNGETATIRAYDPAGLPVSVTNWSMTLVDPILPDSGFQGTVTRDANQINLVGISVDTTEEMAIFRPVPGQRVARLDYAYQNPGGGPTITFATEDCGCCPQLQVERQATDVLVSWPVTGSSCFLQTSVNLSSATWTNWPVAPGVVGNRLQNVVNDDQNTRYFRLKHQ